MLTDRFFVAITVTVDPASYYFLNLNSNVVSLK